MFFYIIFITGTELIWPSRGYRKRILNTLMRNISQRPHGWESIWEVCIGYQLILEFSLLPRIIPKMSYVMPLIFGSVWFSKAFDRAILIVFRMLRDSRLHWSQLSIIVIYSSLAFVTNWFRSLCSANTEVRSVKWMKSSILESRLISLI